MKSQVSSGVWRMLVFCCAVLLCATLAQTSFGNLTAQEVTGVDGASGTCSQDLELFLAHFDGSLASAGGEQPLQGTGVVIQPGLVGQAAYFPPGSALRYASAGSITAKTGTVEFWIMTTWPGNDTNQNRFALAWGGGGGILLGKDGGNFWRMIGSVRVLVPNRAQAAGSPTTGRPTSGVTRPSPGTANTFACISTLACGLAPP